MSNQEQDNVMVNEHYGISKEAFAKYAADLGVMDAALPNIFKMLEQNKVDPADLGEKLHETAESYKKLLEDVKLLESLLRQARESLEGKDVQGNPVTSDFSKAGELLQQAQVLCQQIVPPMGDVLITPTSTGGYDHYFIRLLRSLRPFESRIGIQNVETCIPCTTTATAAHIPPCCPPKK
jgi:hypothetical protein